ncbi:helix-turn-helix domain-containing protein [Vagococcus zengguangii]|uniref:Helix-turn-helix transcriptional regulator n=1 Tax=Vagococcus zengguangii TaxID=2571750 RepID=A0A4D7CUC4_9ENTE|nr:helix-turn-helix transcriptional regulator [Vagococcus zengguangii]QCI86632.1 helix-turn-helix transcriptional regulator [Vagococcus zengguangii]
MKEEKIIDKDNIIGKNIKRIRISKGIGQTELVEQLQLKDINITRESLVKIEGGRQHIKLTQLKGIKELLDVSYDEFLS